MSTPPYLRLVPLEEEEEPVEVELEISPRDLAVMAASVCAALAAFWWLWKRLVKEAGSFAAPAASFFLDAQKETNGPGHLLLALRANSP